MAVITRTALAAILAVCAALGSCVWRYADAAVEALPSMSPAQEARNKQIDEALRSSFPVEQHCAKRITYGDTMICISASQLKRMEEERK